MKRSPSWNRGRLSVLLFLAMGSAGIVLAPLAAQDAVRCEQDEDYRALDFLLGEWRLVMDGEVVGGSRAEKLEEGCLIVETWEFDDGRSGRRYSAYDGVAGVWHRFAVSSGGVVERTSGAMEDGGLVFRGERSVPGGRTSNWRERLAAADGGRVHWIAGRSARGVAFDGYYEPLGGGPPSEEPAPAEAPAPVAPAPVAPAPVDTAPVDTAAVEAASELPAPAAVEPDATRSVNEVVAESARAADAARIERIAMASPMVLRLPLGPVESLPGGYAWITRDTAPYLCEGVTIERLEVQRRRRRGQVELRVELAVQAVQVSRGVEVGIDLVQVGSAQGDVVLSSGQGSGRAGRGIPEQIQDGTVGLAVTLPLTTEIFDAATAGEERPELVITVAVAR